MTLMQCGVDCNKSYQTMLRWVAQSKFKFKRKGKKIWVDPDVWAKFCRDNDILRKGDG